MAIRSTYYSKELAQSSQATVCSGLDKARLVRPARKLQQYSAVCPPLYPLPPPFVLAATTTSIIPPTTYITRCAPSLLSTSPSSLSHVDRTRSSSRRNASQWAFRSSTLTGRATTRVPQDAQCFGRSSSRPQPTSSHRTRTRSYGGHRRPLFHHYSASLAPAPASAVRRPVPRRRDRRRRTAHPSLRQLGHVHRAQGRARAAAKGRLHQERAVHGTRRATAVAGRRAMKLDQDYVRPTNAQTAAGSSAGPAATPGPKTLDRPEQPEAHATDHAGSSIAGTKFKRPNRKLPKNATDVRQTPAALQRARAQSTAADASQRTPSTDADPHPEHAFRPHPSALPPLRLPPTLPLQLQLPRPASTSTSTSTNNSPNSSSTTSDHNPLEPLRPPAPPPIPLQSMPYPHPPGAGQQFEFKFEYASQGASSSTVTLDQKPHDSRGPEPAKMVFVGGRPQAQQAPPRKKPGAGPARKRKDKDKAKAAPGPSTSRG
ncbi:hypothetical protein OH76DRAFT_837648 [Lentinus brumalis]|uniref:Uncharacterized protein n=1 Tax=Lentinus brumalis TaxID=2498619 RepID=A0A371D1L1_9APHY|nr:hypothetical protein OH76DRAFT_837648 [Polyporus brumalis]